jgi:hypothetical protein
MINLTNTSSKIQVITSTTADVDVSASYMDYNGTTVTPGGLLSKITTATTTDIIGVPGASTTRNVKSIEVANVHASTANTVTIQQYNGTSTVRLWKGNLLASEKIDWVDGRGFVKYNASGQEQVASSTVSAVTETEIDFGSTPVSEASFTITDSAITSSAMRVMATVSYSAPTGKDQDELEMDDLQLRAVAGSGNFVLYVRAADGSYLADKFKINYSYA